MFVSKKRIEARAPYGEAYTRPLCPIPFMHFSLFCMATLQEIDIAADIQMIKFKRFIDLLVRIVPMSGGNPSKKAFF